MLLRSYLLILSLVLVVHFVSAQIPPCTKQDFAAKYDECINGQRKILFYKTKECTEIEGESIPYSNATIPCDITCNNGFYLSAPNTQCQACPLGTVSYSEGLYVDYWTENMLNIMNPSESSRKPGHFYTWCTTSNGYNENCKPWKVVDRALEGEEEVNYLDSGAQTESINFQSSTLALDVDIIRPDTDSRIQFEYKIDAERFLDGLEVSVDGTVLHGKMDLLATGHYEKISIPLTKGFHRIQWKFSKDSLTPIQKGKNRAYIRMIQVFGNELYDTKCSPCRLGYTTSEIGQEECLPCPANTYRNSTDSIICTPCTNIQQEYALPGSKQCKLRPVCKQMDYYAFYNPICDSLSKTRTFEYRWFNNTICNKQSDTPVLPEPLIKSCAPCPLGTGNFQKHNNNCNECSKGYVYVSRDRTCHPCSSGSAAIKYLTYDHDMLTSFPILPEGFSSKCYEGCGDNFRGWRIVHSSDKESYINSNGVENYDYEHDPTVYGGVSSMIIPLHLYTHGKVMMNLEIIDHDTIAQNSQLYLFLDGKLMHSFTKQDLDLIKGAYSSDIIAPGVHSLELVYEKYLSNDYAAHVRIYYMQVEGESHGYAINCIPCLAGTKCEETTDKIELCPPGTYSNDKSGVCLKCKENTYNDKYGQAQCIPCKSGTFAKEGSTVCENACKYAIGGTEIEYNLQALDKQMQQQELTNGFIQGPFKVSNASLQMYFSLCNRFDTSHESFCKKSTLESEKQGMISYACVDIKDDYSVNVGHLVSYESLPIEKRDQGLIMHFEGPDNELISLCTGTTSQKRMINLKLLCDPNINPGKPIVTTPLSALSLGENSFCQLDLEWKSFAACPICTIYDIDYTVSTCSNGMKTKKYFWKTNRRVECYRDGSVVLPEDVIEPCPICTAQDMIRIEGSCENNLRKVTYAWKEPKNCTEEVLRFKLPETEYVSCNDVVLKGFTAIAVVFIIAMVLIILVISLCVLYRKNRKLHEEYTLLSSAKKKKKKKQSIEMQHMEKDESEEEEEEEEDLEGNALQDSDDDEFLDEEEKEQIKEKVIKSIGFVDEENGNNNAQ